jgi:glycosyltransferase involved in cell wall biosynthesis
VNPPRLLLLLAQSPFDASSGAALSMRGMATLLARAGWQVRSLATTATENAADHAALLHARHAGVWRTESLAPRTPAMRASIDGVEHLLLLVAPEHSRTWQREVGPAYDAAYAALLAEWRPDIVLTFGGNADDQQRRNAARGAGARVVFALHNLAYLHPGSPAPALAALQEPLHLLAPSHFVAKRYEAAVGRRVNVLSPPIDVAEARADAHEPVFALFVNPEPAKGLMFIATLAARLGRERPDIPLLVVEGRGRAEHFLAAGRRAGVDLARFPNVLISPGGVQTRELFANARVLLMPSVWEEPAGRLALEALVNGVPALVSERGGLPEMVGNAGTVLPLPATLTMDTRAPVPVADTDAWFDMLVRIADDDAFHHALSMRARSEADARLTDAAQVAAVAAFFGRLLVGS